MTTSGATLVLAGRLEAIPLSDVLQLLAEGRRSGVLDVEREQPHLSGRFQLDDGKVLRAEIDRQPQLLGLILLRRSLIDAEILAEALRRQGDAYVRRPLGSLLVEMDAVAPALLAEALEEQVHAHACEMLGWDRGVFRFKIPEPGLDLSPRATVEIAVDPRAVLLHAMARVDESSPRP